MYEQGIVRKAEHRLNWLYAGIADALIILP